MNYLVLDCSVTMSWFFTDEYSPHVQYVRKCLETDWIARIPHLWVTEILNSFLTAERRNRIDAWSTFISLNILRRLPVQIEPVPDIQTQLQILYLSRTFNLTAYDASYLERALRSGYPIATLDQEIQKAAYAAGVNLLQQ